LAGQFFEVHKKTYFTGIKGIKEMGDMKFDELTEKIIAACFEVSNELGICFLESVYEKALLVALCDKGLSAERQVPLKVDFRDVVVGEFFADILVEGKIILELKSVKGLLPVHVSQVLNYLRSSKIQTGLLINFGQSRLEYRRFNNRF
jgi:GxxExxY protein